MQSGKCFKFMEQIHENTQWFDDFCDCGYELGHGTHSDDCKTVAYRKDWDAAMSDLEELERAYFWCLENKVFEKKAEALPTPPNPKGLGIRAGDLL